VIWVSRSVLLSMAMVVMMITVGPSAQAETVHFSFKGQEASVSFLSSTGSCLQNYVSVSARIGDGKTGQPKPSEQHAATVIVDTHDTCTGEQIRGAYGEPTLGAGQLTINNLDSASMKAEVELFDFKSGANISIFVSLTWTGVGVPTSGNNHEHFRTPAFSYNSYFNGTFRDAIAFGTVTDGTTNFTIGPAESAHLSSVKNGTVYVIHERQ
jgi:hypothetical protein